MQGKKAYQEKLFLNFQLSSAVPEDNFYRKLNELVDFSFLYKTTSQYYGSEGQRSIDPVVFMKLMLVGYLENLNSDRRIISMSRLRLDIRYFIGYDIDEELPWHSTLSRTRQLYSESVFIDLFKRILKQCIDRGMISGRRQAVDGFFIKANASLDSLVQKEILDDAFSYSQELKTNQEEQPDLKILETWKQEDHKTEDPKRNLSNDTHYSPSDPDARVSVKPGKPVALNYLGQVSVDTATHVITHVQAFTADKRDSECLSAVLRHVKYNLADNDVMIQELVADSGYSSADALKALQASRVTGYIPNRSHFKYERAGFSYHEAEDYYLCSQGLKIYYQGTYLTGGYWMKQYGASAKKCHECPIKGQCTAYKMKYRKVAINETIDKPYYDQMHQRMQTSKARKLMRLRQSTVEPVIGTLVNYLGIKRVNTKGLSQANKCLTMAAIAYNLKKILNHKGRLIQNQLKAVKTKIISTVNYYCNIPIYKVILPH